MPSMCTNNVVMDRLLFDCLMQTKTAMSVWVPDNAQTSLHPNVTSQCRLGNQRYDINPAAGQLLGKQSQMSRTQRCPEICSNQEWCEEKNEFLNRSEVHNDGLKLLELLY